MKLRTEINVGSFPFYLNHKDPILLMGSCFTQSIGTKLKQNGFKTFENPYGISFNPISIAIQLDEISKKKMYTKADLKQYNGQFFSYQHHSSFNGPDTGKVLQGINDQILLAHDFLKRTKVLFISLGTSWVWKLKESNLTVNNCHKVPSSEFNLELYGAQDVQVLYKKLISDLNEHYPNLQIVFTVSPVRHWKNGGIENSRSKANLITLVHNLSDEFDNIHYFPSYEIMLDDLRDYRFYKDDLLHPSDLAVEYIWQKFYSAFFTKETIELNKKAKKVWSMLNHRPMSNDPKTIEDYQNKLNESRLSLKNEYGIEI